VVPLGGSKPLKMDTLDTLVRGRPTELVDESVRDAIFREPPGERPLKLSMGMSTQAPAFILETVTHTYTVSSAASSRRCQRALIYIRGSELAGAGRTDTIQANHKSSNKRTYVSSRTRAQP
jgi:hypothetical protein